ncbi:MAG: DUF4178 domain-containing protein [Bacteroidetes bacterium]|nr:DUF4178 domain-containing protein [Bacteroidota bacterium]
MNFSPVTISDCPFCKTLLTFRSDKSNGIVCHVCHTALWRKDGHTLEELPMNAGIPQTEHIQPGTTGSYEGNTFTVLGRVRLFFEEVVYNYWSIEWADKKLSFLAEGYGMFAILKSMQLPQAETSATLQKMKHGSLLDLLPRQDFLLEKKQAVLDIDAEGEFFLPVQHKKFTVYDLAAKDGNRISFFDFDQDRVFTYDLRIVNRKELKLSNTRNASPVPRDIICEDCKTTFQVKTFPYAQSCACPNCGQFYILQTSGEVKKEGKASTGIMPAIPLGSTGTIHGIAYEVLGYTQKQERNIYKSQWREYTLYNAEEGYAFLSEFDGHWIYLREQTDAPVLFYNKELEFEFDKKKFLLFNSYTYNIINARGAFTYNSFDNKNTECFEYICPPYIWIQEKDPYEGYRWFNGVHISNRDVASAFQAPDLPARVGVGAVQPGGLTLQQLIVATLVGLLSLFAINYLFNAGKAERVLMDEQFVFADSVNSQTYVTPRYELEKRRSNIRFDIYADVSNSWMELGVTLTNVNTGKEYTLEKGVEYYYGYSDGESWTEGSTRDVTYFKRIPAGTYFLELQALRDRGPGRPNTYMVKITYDVPSYRNLYISIILFLLWPVITFFLIRYKETHRWQHSP